MRRVMILLAAGTVLSGLAAAYAASAKPMTELPTPEARRD